MSRYILHTHGISLLYRHTHSRRLLFRDSSLYCVSGGVHRTGGYTGAAEPLGSKRLSESAGELLYLLYRSTCSCHSVVQAFGDFFELLLGHRADAATRHTFNGTDHLLGILAKYIAHGLHGLQHLLHIFSNRLFRNACGFKSFAGITAITFFYDTL